jgi:protein-disulfide isomerase
MAFQNKTTPLLLVFFLLSAILFVFFAVGSTPPEHRISLSENLPQLTEPSVSFLDPQKGAEDARVTLVEFGDFACAPCAELHTTLGRLFNAHPEDLRIVWKDFPNESLHPEALKAALAARCAQSQGAFWAYADELFARTYLLGPATYRDIAQEIGLSITTFDRCLSSQDELPKVQKTFEEGLALDLSATPTIFVGTQRSVGALSFEALERIVSPLLREGP